MLDYIIERTNRYIDDMPKKERKKYGQFLQVKKQHVLWLDYILFLRTCPKSVF